MVVVSYSGKEINAKLVYYGPGLSGKTTNLEYIYQSVPSTNRGKMVSMKTRTERTLFFDFLPIDLGDIGGFKTRFLLYTVPGQVYYNATRKLVLRGVDAIIFVADSARGKMDENIESLQNLRDNLKEYGLSLDEIPWVIQYNKRDLPDVYTVEELEEALNPDRVPHWEVVATTGVGVFESFRGIAKLLLQKLGTEIKLGDGKGSSPASRSAARPAAAPAARKPAAPPRPAAAAPEAPAPQAPGLETGRPYRPGAAPRPAAAQEPPLTPGPYSPRAAAGGPARPQAAQTPPVSKPAPAPRAQAPAPRPAAPPPPVEAAESDLLTAGTEPEDFGLASPAASHPPDVRETGTQTPAGTPSVSPAEEEAALAAEIQKRAEARGRSFDGEDGDVDVETSKPKKGFWSRIFRRQSEDQVTDFYSEPEGLPELGEDRIEAPEPRFQEPEPETAGEDNEEPQPSFQLDDADTGEEAPAGGSFLDLQDEPEPEAPVPPALSEPAPAARPAPVEIPVARGAGDGTPVLIERRVQIPITLGAEEIMRGARLRLVLEIEVEASESAGVPPATADRTIRNRVA